MNDTPGITPAELAEIRKTLDDRSRVSSHYEGCHLDPLHRDCLARRLVAEVERLRETADQLAAALERTCRRWTFSNDQQHTHTWHDWADCVPAAKQLLARLARGRGDAGNPDRRMT